MKYAIEHPYLSIVTVSRNDEHGGDPQRRTQIFINSYAWQAKHYKLETELILVDWNPPKEKPGLAESLNFPANEYFYARVIVIPPELHEGFRYSETFPLFQFIGKNAGIRRARGEFILATCMDSILDDRLFKYFACRRLREDWLYRADLYDVKNSIPDTGHYVQQDFCRKPEYEDLSRGKFQKYRALWEEDRIYAKDAFRCRADFPWLELIDDDGVIIGKSTTKDLNNKNFEANGDFTLMHKKAWHKLSGYGEFESFSMNIDSQLMAHAIFYGFAEANFLPPYVCYHIAHGFQRNKESDFIAVSEHLKEMVKSFLPVFKANIYEKNGIASMEKVFNKLQQNPHDLPNDERWGLRDINLQEYIFDKEGNRLQETKPKPIGFKTISAIKPEFYFEKIAFESFSDVIDTKDSLINERDILLSERDYLINAKDSIINERDSLLVEKDLLIKEKDSIINERNLLLNEKDLIIKEKDILIEELRVPSKADRVVEKIHQHYIIWFLVRCAYRVSVKIYKMLKAIRFFIKEVIKFLLPYFVVRLIQIRKENI